MEKAPAVRNDADVQRGLALLDEMQAIGSTLSVLRNVGIMEEVPVGHDGAQKRMVELWNEAKKRWNKEFGNASDLVNAWRVSNGYALPPLSPRSRAARLPRLSASFGKEGDVQLHASDDAALVVRGDVVTIKRLQQDGRSDEWAGRRGKVMDVTFSVDDDEVELLRKSKHTDDLPSVMVRVKTDAGAVCVCRPDECAIDGDWAPKPAPYKDPDANDMEQNPHWLVESHPIPPWRLLAKVCGLSRKRDARQQYRNAHPQSEDAHMFNEAAKDAYARGFRTWDTWARQHPGEALRLIERYDAAMRHAGLECPVPNGLRAFLEPSEPAQARGEASRSINDGREGAACRL